MPGPAPKRPENRTRRPRGTALVTLPGGKGRSGPLIPRPEAPKGILPRVVALWETFWGSPLADHVIDSDRAALGRLFGYYDQRERFLEQGMKAAVVAGSTGQSTLSPLLKQVDILDGKILALEDRFGLSPMARLKLQVTLGDASRSLADINAALTASRDEPEAEPADDPRRIAFSA
jgi:hypothetical protein